MEAAMVTARTRVLVVDDDDAVRHSVILALERFGYTVNGACDGEECILLQENSPYDIAIIDMMMPNKDGIETIRELKEKFPALRIIAMSGASAFAKINYLEVAMLIGATATLQKPFGGDELANALKEFAPA